MTAGAPRRPPASPGAAAEWLVIKYLADVTRGEPRNVGLIFRGDGPAQLRMLDADVVAAFGADRDNYLAWSAWFSYAVESGVGDDVLCSPRPGDGYVVVRSGSLLAGRASPSMVDDLFAQLVEPPRLHAGLVAQLRVAADGGTSTGELRALAAQAAAALEAAR